MTQLTGISFVYVIQVGAFILIRGIKRNSAINTYDNTDYCSSVDWESIPQLLWICSQQE